MEASCSTCCASSPARRRGPPSRARGATLPPQSHRLALVVFDLDGTISRRDTFAAYIGGFLRRHRGRAWRLIAILPALLGAVVGWVDRGALKSAVMRAALGGCERGVINQWTREYVGRLLNRGVFADALATITECRQRGDYLVLMSASPDLYVPQIAQRLGFAESISSGVRWQGDRLEGTLTTPNRRGAEKARCFAEPRAAAARRNAAQGFTTQASSARRR